MTETTQTQKTTKKVAGFRITTKQDGFRRAGREWTGTTEVLASDLNKEQQKQLLDEPKLIVEKIQLSVAE